MLRNRRGVTTACLLLMGSALACVPAGAAGNFNSFAKVADLHFGDFAVMSSCVNCSVTIDPATGQRSASGGVVLRASNGGRRAEYSLRMTGCGQGCSYTASVTPASINMVTSGGTMTVTAFTTSQTALDNQGRGTMYVGGTLHIPSVSVAAGSYSASFTANAVP